LFSRFKSHDEYFWLFPTPPEKDETPLLAFIKDEKDEEEHSNGLINPLIDEENFVIRMIEETKNKSNIWINTKTTTSQLLHQTHDEKKKDILLKEQIPEEYHKFLDVFDEKKADRFPEERIWDHKIELKDRFIPKSFKNYNLTPIEQVELDKFKENLEKGYIRPSQSPMASPFFFVSKKDAGKLRPCQDYRYLNEWMIKNAYLLPLISEIIDKLKGARYFTKLDV